MRGRRGDRADRTAHGVEPGPGNYAALVGNELTPAVVSRAADAALAGAQPLAHNGYKLPLTGSLIRQAQGSLHT
jgi:CO/xanthine dehydrogenase FAD-binding subunit